MINIGESVQWIFRIPINGYETDNEERSIENLEVEMMFICQ